MSGGSMDYIYYKVDEAGDLAEDKEIKELLWDLSKLLKEQEWWWSSDTTEEDYREELAKFKQKWFKSNREERLRGYVDEQLDATKKELYSMIGADNE